MSDRYKGAILSPTAPTVTPQSAGGIYTSSQQLQYQGQGVWPSAFNNPINNSLRLRASATAYLSRTGGTSTSRRIHTFSFWTKSSVIGGTRTVASAGPDDNNREVIFIDSNKFTYQVKIASTFYDLESTQVFRDPAAWYHFVCAVDTTQATSSNRVKIYVNGVQITAFGTATYPPQNADLFFDDSNGSVSYIGALRGYVGSIGQYDGYMTEFNFVDGQQLTPSSFGTTDAYGIWQPIPYTGTYGTNGFYLKFTDNSALTTSSNVGLGKDFSGNGNYWVTNNISITAGSTYDSMVDVPTNTNQNTANYAVMNPLVAGTSSTLSNGNLTYTNSTGTGIQALSSMFVTSGSYYFEATLTTAGGGGTSVFVNVGDGSTYYATNGQIYSGGVLQTTVATLTSGDVVGLAFTVGGSVTYYKNGTSVFTGGVGGIVPFVNGFSGTVWNVNFGQRPFAYTPPTGFNRLNTYNLPTPTILAGNQYMDATLYTGNGTTQSITNSGSMQPDWVWIKSRSLAYAHNLGDSVRGVNNTLSSNSTGAENYAGSGDITAFNTNGFSIRQTSNWELSSSGATYIAWQWRASNAAGVSNTQGTITSTVSVNTTAGFSVVTYTGNGTAGATVGHGLGVAPSMVIVKRRNGVASWIVNHTSAGTGFLLLENTVAYNSATTYWTTAPTSSLLPTLTSNSEVNGTSNTYVAYCFAQVAGYSAFGSYTGNGSSDGPFVFTGFRPRFLMMKRSSSGTANWYIFDSARSTYNAIDVGIYPNLSNAETALGAQTYDFLSNGFKLRQTNADFNESGIGYIYMAFAENPFKIARGR